MTLPSPERPTARSGRLALVALVLLAWLLPAAGFAQVDTTSLETRIGAARATYDTQLQSFTTRRTRFDAYLLEIDALTAERADASTLANDEAVRNARRVGREMALELQRDSVALRTLLDQIRGLEGELLTVLDERQRQLEAQLVSTPAGSPERGVLMAELVRLSETSGRYLEPLAALPEISVDEILLGLEHETTPEELLATADELSDHERRLEAHLGDLERHIRQLRLRENDRVFRSEASLFEEGQNSGRREGRPAGDSSGETSGPDRRGSESPDSGGQPETPAATPGEGNTPTGGGGAETDEPPLAGSPSAGPENPDDQFTDSGGRSEDNDGLGVGGASQDPETPDFGTGFDPTPSPPSLIGTTTSVQDPTQLIMLNTEEGRPGETERSTHRRLEQLQEEREDTERTLREVREQRGRLLDRVNTLEAQEGF